MNVFDQFPYLNNMITPDELECIKEKVLSEECVYQLNEYEDLQAKLEVLIQDINFNIDTIEDYEIMKLYCVYAIQYLKLKQCIYESFPCFGESKVTEILAVYTKLNDLINPRNNI